MSELSRWDLLHLVYSLDHKPVTEEDRRQLRVVLKRVYDVLGTCQPPEVIAVRP